MNNTSIVYTLFVCFFLRTTHASSIHDEVASLRNRLDHLEKEYIRENERLISRIHSLENDNKALKTVTDNQEKVLQDCVFNNTVLIGNKRRRSFPDVSYAFTAVLDHNIEHAGIDQTVVFNKVLLNDGNAYNNHTGIFTVPVEGVYMFYFAFGSGYNPHKVWMHIVVDGSAEVAGVAHTLQPGHDIQGTNLALLHLNKGDSVWVATYAHVDVIIYGITKLTTFSGILLYQ